VSVAELIQRMQGKPGQPFDWGRFRKEIIEEHKHATTETDRVTLLGLYKTLMDHVERGAKFSEEDRAGFKELRSQEYNLLLIQEATMIGGRTDGLLDPTVMKRITAREVAAGRMASDDGLHTLSVAGAEAPMAKKPMPVAGKDIATSASSMAGRLGQVLSWTANIIALAILALFGFIGLYDNSLGGSLFVGVVVAVVIWLVGRGVRYVLAGS
jgi:hypothetical protein